MNGSRLKLVFAALALTTCPAVSAQAQDENAGLELNHFYQAISVQDLETVSAFYVDKLGFEVEKDAAFGDAIKFRWLTNGSARVELIQMTGSQAGPERGPPPGHLGVQGFSHLGLETRDIEATRAALVAKGVENVGPVSLLPPLGMKALFVSDPEGNAIEIIEVIKE
jgi:catechol 2,3-dioxygenase-like lactoylglutathione lyase family enzyme